ncbi:hypothetical protein T492DRAFT_1134885 [Pavlovales sp. CCMP2436]|nr:hypothetical protein T492DRAFT_1134885 [Pavlovales sp. CCMP2436]
MSLAVFPTNRWVHVTYTASSASISNLAFYIDCIKQGSTVGQVVLFAAGATRSLRRGDRLGVRRAARGHAELQLNTGRQRTLARYRRGHGAAVRTIPVLHYVQDVTDRWPRKLGSLGYAYGTGASSLVYGAIGSYVELPYVYSSSTTTISGSKTLSISFDAYLPSGESMLLNTSSANSMQLFQFGEGRMQLQSFVPAPSAAYLFALGNTASDLFGTRALTRVDTTSETTAPLMSREPTQLRAGRASKLSLPICQHMELHSKGGVVRLELGLTAEDRLRLQRVLNEVLPAEPVRRHLPKRAASIPKPQLHAARVGVVRAPRRPGNRGLAAQRDDVESDLLALDLHNRCGRWRKRRQSGDAAERCGSERAQHRDRTANERRVERVHVSEIPAHAELLYHHGPRVPHGHLGTYVLFGEEASRDMQHLAKILVVPSVVVKSTYTSTMRSV